MYNRNNQVKFIDFGFAIVNKKKKSEMETVGTPYYIAPEVLTGNYGKECDIWSLGICIYQLLTGQMPFDGESQEEVFDKITSGEFDIPNHLSDQCKDLLKQMICVEPSKRISTLNAINHPWI